jgi:hypothetical protein
MPIHGAVLGVSGDGSGTPFRMDCFCEVSHWSGTVPGDRDPTKASVVGSPRITHLFMAQVAIGCGGSGRRVVGWKLPEEARTGRLMTVFCGSEIGVNINVIVLLCRKSVSMLQTEGILALWIARRLRAWIQRTYICAAQGWMSEEVTRGDH